LEILPTDEILFTKIYTDIIIEGRQYTVEKSSHDLSKRYYSNYFYSPRRGYCACMIQDITKIRRLEKKNIESLEKSNRLLKERNEEQERYEIITKQTGSIVFEWNFEKKMFYCSENFQEFENGAAEMQKSFITEPNLESIHDDDKKQMVKDFFNPMYRGSEFVETTVRIKKTADEFVWCKISAHCNYNGKGTLIRTIGTIKDINNEVNYLNRLKYDAEFDAVTGIYNKRSFYENTKKLLKDYQNKDFVIIRFDINRFKIINELFGVEEGNKLLTYLGEILKNEVLKFEKGSYGRLEADVFCACVPNYTKKVDEFVAILENVGPNYNLDFDIVPSIGIYIIDDRTIPIDVMCDFAKLAQQTIKGNYLIRHAYFDEKLSRNIRKEQEIINMMNIALAEEEFQVYLQPKYKLNNNSICGAEALARWVHPVKGMIYPNDFIPIFERNGFIMKLDAYIWEKVCKLLRKWLDEGEDPYPVSVNISKVNLYNPQLCETIINLVEKYRIPPNLLELELTESAYTDNKKLLSDIMGRLQSYGFVMMMDDFGSGYSSLNMLKEIPVDVLKIDLRFLSDFKGERNKGSNILSSVVRMAKWLNLHVIAEGIETKEQSDFLRSIGCPDGQGYYFSKPLPVPEYENMMRADALKNKKSQENILQNDIDIDDIWSPDAQANMVFSSIVSAVAIYETYNDQIEILRVNDGYYDLTGSDRDFDSATGIITKVIYAQDYNKVLEIFRTATETKDFAQGEYRRYRKDGSLIWVRLRLKYLTQVGDRYVFYGSLTDITNEKMTQEELRLAREKIEEQHKIMLEAGIEEKP
ncbi:MAG: EAL domain-containing protein, partial [Oscillospiraceae bacterium]